MKKNLKINTKRAQSLVEYAIVIGVVSAAFVAISAYMQRGIQSVLKTTADQVGVQSKGDQTSSSEFGYLDTSNAKENSAKKKATDETLGQFTYSYNDSTTTYSNSLSNYGFTPGTP